MARLQRQRGILVQHGIAPLVAGEIGAGVIASFHTAAPTEARIGMMAFRPVKPRSMSRTLQKIDSGLFHKEWLIGREYNRVITIGRVVANAATFEITVIRRQRFFMLLLGRGFPGYSLGFVVHAMVIPRAKLMQRVAQKIFRCLVHKNRQSWWDWHECTQKDSLSEMLIFIVIWRQTEHSLVCLCNAA